jgi:tetratricopeptide (TPR) repeat protein
LSIAPNLPIARSALAFAYGLNLQLSESLREHGVALSLAGGDPDVMRNYGWTRSNIFGNGDGLRLVDQALALDPLNWASHLAHVDVLYVARRYAEAVSYTLNLQQQSPELFKFPILFGNSLLMLGRAKEAALVFGKVSDGDSSKLAALRQLDGEMASYRYGQIYAQLSDKDRAFAALDRAWAIRDSSLMKLKVDPYMDPLRSDPRYAALVKRIGFPA